MRNIQIYENLDSNSDMRFYPSYIPIICFEPLKIHFSILESPEEIRKGIVSLISIPKDQLVAKLTGFVLDFQTLHSLQYKEGVYYADEFFAGYLLHSCDPNCKLNMEDFSLHAIKDIRPFDKITIDYEETEDYLYNTFDCNCGSSVCKGKIMGSKARVEMREKMADNFIETVKNKKIYTEDAIKGIIGD